MADATASESGARRREREQRRHVTVLFSDLCGSTRLGRAIDPEILDEVLQHVKDEVARVIEERGGILVQFHGDGALAIFGHPSPAEDDVRRATEAALDLHAAIRGLDLRHLVPPSFELRMHSGIHAGLVLVRDGDAVQGRFELVGDAPNTAAGLSGAAGVDEILASRDTLIGVLPFFETEAVPPLSLKGIAEPLATYRVRRRSGIRTRFEASERRGLAPFIGRRDVLERLGRSLEQARRGRLDRVRVIGDAGLGKTRTVEEFLRRARTEGATVLCGHCESHGSIAPLWPFRLMLRQALALGPDPTEPADPGPIVERLRRLDLVEQTGDLLALLSVRPEPAASGADGTAPSSAAGAIGAFGALLAALAREKPLVLFVDDWQWADDTSRVVAAALDRILRESPVLRILTSRPTETGATGAADEAVIELAPFREIETAEAVEALSPTGLDLGVADQLHHRSGGNPLFLEELCRSLRLQEGRAEVAADVPPTLHGLIERRVLALPDSESNVLQAAAVIGNVVPLWLLREAVGPRELDARLVALEAKDLLYPGPDEGTLRFKHGITRDAVYHTVRLSQRRQLHARIAEALVERYREREAEKPYESLAYHYEGAADYAAACDHAEIAGDRAWASAALDRTRQQYGAALAALDRLPETEERQRRWLSISRRRAFACVYNPALEQLDMLSRAARIAERLDDPDALGHAHFWHGFISYSLGDLPESIARYREGLVAARRAGNARLVAQLRANLGEGRAAACEYDEALSLLDESIESKRRLKASRSADGGPVASGRAPTGSAFALATKAFVLADRGEADEADALFEASLGAVRGTGHPVEGSCRAFLATRLVLCGRFEEAVPLADRVQRTGERMNGPYLYGRGRTEGAYARYMLGGREDDLEILRETTDWLDAKGIRLYLSVGLACLADALWRADRLELAERYAERALARAEALDRVAEGLACRTLARLVARREPDAPERADAWLDRATSIAEKRGAARDLALTRLTRAELLAERGERDAARRQLGRARPDLERMRLVWHAEQARRLAAALT